MEPPSGEDMLDLTAANAAVTTIHHVSAWHDFFISPRKDDIPDIVWKKHWLIQTDK